MAEKSVFIFDFDGTIADTFEAFFEAYNEAAKKYHCKTVERKDIPMLRDTAALRDRLREYGISFWKLPFLFKAIRSGLKHRRPSIRPQEGTAEMLRSLKERGTIVGILTSNSVENVDAFLRKEQLRDVVSFIDSSNRLFGKHIALKKIMRANGFDTKDVSYIGDDLRDVKAAKEAGVRSIAVTWGFQSRRALETGNPDVIVDEPRQLLDL